MAQQEDTTHQLVDYDELDFIEWTSKSSSEESFSASLSSTSSTTAYSIIDDLPDLTLTSPNDSDQKPEIQRKSTEKPDSDWTAGSICAKSFTIAASSPISSPTRSHPSTSSSSSSHQETGPETAQTQNDDDDDDADQPDPEPMCILPPPLNWNPQQLMLQPNPPKPYTRPFHYLCLKCAYRTEYLEEMQMHFKFWHASDHGPFLRPIHMPLSLVRYRHSYR